MNRPPLRGTRGSTGFPTAASWASILLYLGPARLVIGDELSLDDARNFTLANLTGSSGSRWLFRRHHGRIGLG